MRMIHLHIIAIFRQLAMVATLHVWPVIMTSCSKWSLIFFCAFKSVHVRTADGGLGEDSNLVRLSRAAVQALTFQLFKDTIAAFNLVWGKVKRLEISWIEALVGRVWGNYRADQLARESYKYKPNVHSILVPYIHFKLELWISLP